MIPGNLPSGNLLFVFRFLLAGAVLLAVPFFAYAQESSVVIEKNSSLRRKVEPHKASIYSAVIPGLGQAYNGKYWKIPIIYGGLAGLGAMAIFYDENYSRYRTALQYRTDGIPETLDEFANDPRYTPEVLTSFKDFYRRNRDRSVIFMFLLYGLNIIDATVDAHFMDFDIGEDLSLRVEPTLKTPVPVNHLQSPTLYGVKLNFRF